MKFTNKQYDWAKRILVIIVPGAVAAITSLGALYGFDTELIVGTITILSTFAGVVLNASSKNYNQDKPRIDPYDVDNEFTLEKDFPDDDEGGNI